MTSRPPAAPTHHPSVSRSLLPLPALPSLTMAVQAQYPSNLLFHHRGEPERKEMDMPRPPQFAGVSPAAVYFSSAGGVCVRLTDARQEEEEEEDVVSGEPVIRVLGSYVTVSVSCSERQQSEEAAEGRHGAGERGLRQSVHSPAAAVDAVPQHGRALPEPEQGLVVPVPRRHRHRHRARVHWPPPRIRRAAAAGDGEQTDECLALLVVAIAVRLRLRRACRAGETARRRDRPIHPRTGRAAQACDGRSAAAPQPGDSGEGRPVRGAPAAGEGGGSGARGAARRGAGGAARAPPRRGGGVAGQGAVGAGRRGHPPRAAPAGGGRGAGVGRGARRGGRRGPRGVLVVGVRGPSPRWAGAVGPRVPGLPPQAGLRGAPPLQAPPPLRRVLRRRRRGRRHGVPRVPVRADGQRGGHPLLSCSPARLARPIRLVSR